MKGYLRPVTRDLTRRESLPVGGGGRGQVCGGDLRRPEKREKKLHRTGEKDEKE